METILVLAHTEADGSLGKAALETLGAAKTLSASLAGSTLVVGLIGTEVQAAANQIAAAGAARLLALAGAEFAQPNKQPNSSTWLPSDYAKQETMPQGG